ncbi:TolB-like translocation protein [Alkaliphilus serpentinus]|uniref:Uncharacterized protein n=1 Tax=Alkaliphilus serpentinus TaxID=1482731 RepID=A0A833MAE6_9FIRM|nr:hypothetical protein [Alkaliphilus serpentinus]KAB3530728.1 hypothetical protein F8153_06360 [Alkaliphilus serpentinus]
MKVTAHRLFILLMVISLLLTGCTATDDIETESLALQVEEIKEATEVEEEPEIEEVFDIKIEKNEDHFRITGGEIKDFFIWENEEQLLLTDEESGKTLLLKLQEIEWEETNPPIVDLLNDGERIVAIESPLEGRYFIIKETEGFTLYHLSKNSFKSIATIAGEDYPSYKISKDGSRIAFIDDETKNISIYSLNTKQFTSFNLDIEVEEYLKNFHERVILSPKGTYLTLITKDDNGIEGFKSFYSDSGKILHDLIYGVCPVWSNNQNHIAYLYRSSSEAVAKETINGVPLYTSDKLGIFNRGSRKISLVTEVEGPNKIIGGAQWTPNDDILIFTGGDTDLSLLYLYTVKSKSITTYKNDAFIISYQLLENQSLVLNVSQDEGTGLKVVNTGDGSSTTIDEINSFKLSKTNKEIPFLIINDEIIYIKENSLYALDSQNSRCLFKNRREIDSIQYLSNISSIAVVFQDGPATEIAVVPYNPKE